MNLTLRSSLLLVVLATGADDPRPQPEQMLRGHNRAVNSVAFSPDGKELASGSNDGTAKLWNVATGKERATLKGHRGGVHCVAFSPDGRTVASGGNDKTVRLWDTTGRVRGILRGHKGGIYCLAFSPNGRVLAVGGDVQSGIAREDVLGDFRLWDTETGRELLSPKRHIQVIAVCFPPAGRTLAGGELFGHVTLWETASGKIRATFKGHRSLVTSLAFAADGKTLASGSHDNTVRLWDLRTGKTLKTLKGHTHRVHNIALSKEGKLLVSGSQDKTIMFWDTSTGKELATIYEAKPVWSVALSPDAKLVAAGVGETIKIWKVDEVLKHGARQPKRRSPPEKDKGLRP